MKEIGHRRITFEQAVKFNCQTMFNDLRISKSVDINATAPAVWDTLINPEKIALYFTGAETVTTWQIGTEIVFTHHYEGKVFANKGIVLDYNPNYSLSYTYWTAFSNTADKPENYTVIIFGLTALNDGTRLALTQSNFKNEAWFKSLETGWDMVLDKIKEIAER
jgi:uncharacterized protein YndB with AHSA1/START domain